jgi:spore germination cell wall hydrolase CwlJ-like protein
MTDEDRLTRVVYFEARNQGTEGQVAVAHVVINRSEKKGISIADVAKRRKWFSDHVTDGTQMTEVRAEAACRKVAQEAINGTSTDPTRGATHFHSFPHQNSVWGPGELTVVIGKHKFFKGIRF